MRFTNTLKNNEKVSKYIRTLVRKVFKKKSPFYNLKEKKYYI